MIKSKYYSENRLTFPKFSNEQWIIPNPVKSIGFCERAIIRKIYLRSSRGKSYQFESYAASPIIKIRLIVIVEKKQ